MRTARDERFCMFLYVLQSDAAALRLLAPRECGNCEDIEDIPGDAPDGPVANFNQSKNKKFSNRNRRKEHDKRIEKD